MRKFATILLPILIFCSGVYAQDASTGTAGKWKYDLTPYLYMAGLSGDLTMRGIEVKDIDASFSDILSNLDMGFAAHLEATKDNWTIFFDFNYVNISDSPGTRIVRLKSPITELGAGYHMNPNFMFLGGARIDRYKVEITSPHEIIGTLEQTKTWVDPFIGGQASAKLGKAFTVSARGDLGGFSIGSDFTWNIILAGDWRFAQWGSLYFAQRWWEFDYSSDKDTPQRFKLKLRYTGPIVGLGFHF